MSFKKFGMIKLFSGLEIFGYYQVAAGPDGDVVKITNPMFLSFAHGYMEFSEYAVYAEEDYIAFNKAIMSYGPVNVHPKLRELYDTYLSYYLTPESSLDEYIEQGIDVIKVLIEKRASPVEPSQAFSKDQLDSENMTKEDINEFFKSLKTGKNNTN